MRQYFILNFSIHLHHAAFPLRYMQKERNINSHSSPRSVQAFFARFTMTLTTHVRAWLLAAEFSRKIFLHWMDNFTGHSNDKTAVVIVGRHSSSLSLFSVDCLSKNISTIKLSHLTSEASGKCYLSTDLFPLVVALGHHISSLFFSPPSEKPLHTKMQTKSFPEPRSDRSVKRSEYTNTRTTSVLFIKAAGINCNIFSCIVHAFGQIIELVLTMLLTWTLPLTLLVFPLLTLHVYDDQSLNGEVIRLA